MQAGSNAVRAIFGSTRKCANLDYEMAVQELSAKNDKAAKASEAMAASSLLKPVILAPAPTPFFLPHRRPQNQMALRNLVPRKSAASSRGTGSP